MLPGRQTALDIQPKNGSSRHRGTETQRRSRRKIKSWRPPARWRGSSFIFSP